VNLALVLTTFAVILPAELPDKSMLASLVLGTRYRPLPVFLGVAAAFAVHVCVAVAIGGVLALWTAAALALTVGRGLLRRLPTRLVRRLAGLILAALAVLTLVEAVRG
jgi:putative Ca2+/H+ antiporter (TMEM165/GDT1 family)